MTMIECTFEIDKLLDLLFKNEKQSKKKLLLDKGKIVYLQIAIFKTPYIRSPRRRFLKLCHSLHGDDPEICLFVPNRKTGAPYKKSTDELIDFCVDHYTDLLEKHKIKGITTVMPVKQLTAEYGSYELRNKLVHRFDLFLCKNSLLYNPRFLVGLGKAFTTANKHPLGVPFPAVDNEYDPNFEQNIKRAIFSSSFYIKPFSDNYSIPFGTLSHTKAQLKENLKAVLDQISSEDLIPGGLNNIKTIYIWPSQSKTIPLYICPELPDKLPKVFIGSRRKGLSYAEGELSTMPGKKVTVMPNGEVFVTEEENDNGVKLDNIDEESDGSFHDESDEEEVEEKNNSREAKPSLKERKDEDDDETDSEDDEEIEEREQRLLRMKREAEDDSFSPPKKIKKDSDAGDPEVVVKKTNKVKKTGVAKIVTKEMGKKKKKEEEKVKPKLGKKKGEEKVKPKLGKQKGEEKVKAKLEKTKGEEKVKPKLGKQKGEEKVKAKLGKTKGEEKVKAKLEKMKMEKASKKLKLKQEKSKEKGKLKNKLKGNARA